MLFLQLNQQISSVQAASTASGALVGKIAGLNTRMQDGRPGASTALQIRNMGTPLFVIDGVQSDEGQFNNMDFNDIENISILKDASAAIYGIRAANGVVVVTTKKGNRRAKIQFLLMLIMVGRKTQDGFNPLMLKRM